MTMYQNLIRSDKIYAVKALLRQRNVYSGALKAFTRSKTPGSDGLIAEFYLCFWKCLATPLIDCFNKFGLSTELIM